VTEDQVQGTHGLLRITTTLTSPTHDACIAARLHRYHFTLCRASVSNPTSLNRPRQRRALPGRHSLFLLKRTHISQHRARSRGEHRHYIPYHVCRPLRYLLHRHREPSQWVRHDRLDGEQARLLRVRNTPDRHVRDAYDGESSWSSTGLINRLQPLVPAPLPPMSLTRHFTYCQVYRNGRQHAATFEWTMGTHMGMATIGTKKVPMSNLVAPGGDSRCEAVSFRRLPHRRSAPTRASVLALLTSLVHVARVCSARRTEDCSNGARSPACAVPTT
jgi:hypothetical protein